MVMLLWVVRKGFNTSIVSVEYIKIDKAKSSEKVFQYFNCIGGIEDEILMLYGVRSFQYFNCIGGIWLRDITI